MSTLNYFRSSLWLLCILVLSCISLQSCDNRTKDGNRDYSNKDSEEAAKDMNKPAGDATKESDERFLVRAAEINFEEIRLGQLAQQKATEADVRELGRMLAESHTKAKNDLHALSSRKGIAVPLVPTEDTEDKYRKLNEKSGLDFDREYCDKVVAGHKDAVDLYEDAMQGNNDPDVKSWASSRLGEIRNHLAQAQTCEAKLKQLAEKNKI